MNARIILFVAIYFALLSFAGCGGQLYKVTPLPASAPPQISANDPTGIDFGADLLNGDRSLDQFEANLPMAGVIAVDLRLENISSETVDAKKLRFALSDPAGAKFKSISPDKALKRVMKYYGNSFYRQDARLRTRDDYSAIALNLEGKIASQEKRRGFVFFETKRGAKEIGVMTLSITGTRVPVNIQLNPK